MSNPRKYPNRSQRRRPSAQMVSLLQNDALSAYDEIMSATRDVDLEKLSDNLRKRVTELEIRIYTNGLEAGQARNRNWPLRR